MTESRKLHTVVAHDAHDDRHHGAISHPVYATSLFSFATYRDMDDAIQNASDRYIYSRGNNPSVHELEARLAKLEGGERAKCFGSGMGAITSAILSVVGSGEHIVCVDQAYGPARDFMGRYLHKFGIEATFVNGADLAEVEAAIRDNSSLLYLESPSSLMFELQDLRACKRLADKHGLCTIIDNTWATPCLQNPLKLGIDLVVHSLTKYVGGHSDALGGVVIGSAERIERIAGNEYALFGSVMQPQTAALLMRGLRTLPLRLERLQQSALRVARFLEGLPFVDNVRHPGLPSHPQHALALEQMSGFSSLFSFEAGNDLDRLKRFADQLRYFRIGFSWGGYESLVSVLEAAGGTPRAVVPVVRLYIGLEEPDDLIADLTEAFRQAGFPVAE